MFSLEFYHMFWIHFFPLCHFFMDWQKIRNLVTLEILVLAYCSLLQTFILQWTFNFHDFASITLWKIEGQIDNNSTWVPVYEISDPDARTILVPNLRPFTNYRLRITAVNIVGPSNYSAPSRKFQTAQAPPNVPPDNVTV
jgi:hypothetical protein